MAQTAQVKIYRVSELTREIKQVLEMSFPRLWVEGEISNFKRHSSGHLYFTLKDEGSQINCAMWRFRANGLLFEPQDGMQVLVEGEVQVYEKGGYYQLIVHQIQPAGIGALQMRFEQLKQKLRAEGLFEEAHKKPLPAFPERVGVVTSPTGAAIRDIISVVRRRFPAVEIILYPVRVQGEGAAEEIARAIREFNDYGQVDVLIVGRGGGSLEDLWAFNEEVVARAIFESRIPVISAVGHEVDFSIADFVADRRAPTPSAAAEMAVKDRVELLGVLRYYQEKLASLLLNRVQQSRERIQAIQNSYAFRKPGDLIYQKMLQVDELERALQRSLQHFLALRRQRLDSLRLQLDALNPTAILQRGYSITFKDGQIVRDIDQLQVLDIVQVRLARGQFLSQVQMLGSSEEKIEQGKKVNL
ncbi:MAG: exodeoxyribonuclease VII large subunit [Calditrichaeota bacterium]|nr:MAG: exodeoxyribonuclease VII large subunit [Calditrichota bacterium]